MATNVFYNNGKPRWLLSILLLIVALLLIGGGSYWFFSAGNAEKANVNNGGDGKVNDVNNAKAKDNKDVTLVVVETSKAAWEKQPIRVTFAMPGASAERGAHMKWVAGGTGEVNVRLQSESDQPIGFALIGMGGVVPSKVETSLDGTEWLVVEHFQTIDLTMGEEVIGKRYHYWLPGRGYARWVFEKK